MKKWFVTIWAVAFLFAGISTTSEAATKTGWVSSHGHLYYYQSGHLYKGWLKSGSSWYYMNNTGVIQTGWVSVSGKRYYMNNKGVMQTGCVSVGGKRYYADKSGAMQTGWVSVSGKRYYMDKSGVMQTGWISVSGKRYHMDNTGVMQTGWIQDKGNWYFLISSGYLDPNAKHDDNSDSNNVQYFPVTGGETMTAGIYKAVPNGSLSLVQKEDMYVLDWGTGSMFDFSYTPPAVPFQLDDMNMYGVIKGVSTNFDDSYDNIYKPIRSVQSVGTDLYYAKFYFIASYAGGPSGGGGADILQIYKRDKDGNNIKVTNDTVSSEVGTPYYVSGSNIYYAKVENQALNNFTLVKMDLQTGKKITIATNIDDFWINQGTMYYFTADQTGTATSTTIHTLNTNGGKTTDVVIRHSLYGNSPVDGGNYSLSQNGIIETIWDNQQSVDKGYFYDYKTKIEVNLPIDVMRQSYKDSYISVLDVDAQHHRMIAEITDYQTNHTTLGLYDLDGKLLKTFSDNYNTVSIDAVKGEILYIENNTLKTVSF